jgi:tetratricopeptide (TPR) repeat protein
MLYILAKKERTMKAKIFFLLIVFLGSAFPLFSQSAEELIAQGDELYNEMKDMATAKEALAKYREAMNKLDNKYEAYWRIARMHYFIGEHTEKKKDKKTIFSQGIYYATKAVESEPEKPDGHYWLGVNNGKYGETRGVLKSLSLVKPIKRSMNKVIELDRSYEDGGADRVLGRVFFKVPGIAGGSKDKSLEHLLKSKELGPEDALTRIYLAETLLKHKRVDEAREELEYVLNMEDDPRWFKGIEESKEMARELLKDKKFRK